MNIEQKVKEILFELCENKSIENETTLQGDLLLDSLSMVMLLVEIEDNFGIELDESDMNPFDLTTVESIINMVEKYCGDDESE